MSCDKYVCSRCGGENYFVGEVEKDAGFFSYVGKDKLCTLCREIMKKISHREIQASKNNQESKDKFADSKIEILASKANIVSDFTDLELQNLMLDFIETTADPGYLLFTVESLPNASSKAKRIIYELLVNRVGFEKAQMDKLYLNLVVIGSTNSLIYLYLIPQNELDLAQKYLELAIDLEVGENVQSKLNAFNNLAIVNLKQGFNDVAEVILKKNMTSEFKRVSFEARLLLGKMYLLGSNVEDGLQILKDLSTESKTDQNGNEIRYVLESALEIGRYYLDQGISKNAIGWIKMAKGSKIQDIVDEAERLLKEIS